MTSVVLSPTAPCQWSVLFDDGTKQAPHVFGDKRDATPTEAEAYEAVSRAFLSCKYGRLHQINVRKGQVSFATIPGYAVIYTVSGKPPTDILPSVESGLYVKIEKLADRWHQRTY